MRDHRYDERRREPVTTKRTAHHLRIVQALALALVIGAMSGCGSGATSAPKPSAPTAKSMLPIAMSALSTAAPDGKLLVVQTAGAVTATSTAQWEFLIGSPKTDVVYAVIIQNGKGQFEEYGSAGLSSAEWAQVPPTSEWKIDSDVAHEKALSVYPPGKTAAYVAGFVTYVPKSAKDTNAKAMVWTLNFDPASKGTMATSTVEVDMKTGATSLAK